MVTLWVVHFTISILVLENGWIFFLVPFVLLSFLLIAAFLFFGYLIEVFLIAIVGVGFEIPRRQLRSVLMVIFYLMAAACLLWDLSSDIQP